MSRRFMLRCRTSLAVVPVLVVSLGTFAAHAQTATSPETRVDPGPIWTLRTENDKFSTVPGGTDRYYSAGDEISYMSSPGRVPEVASDFARSLYGEGTTWLGFSLAQEIYTPYDTTRIHPDPADHPYAGHLYSTTTLIQDVGNTRNVVAVGLGVIGPSALGKQIQNGFHVLIGDAQTHGWASQLPDEPAAELTVSRTWRVPVVSAGAVETDVLPMVAVGVGTVRDYVQAGGRVRIGHGLERDFGPGRITDGPSGQDAYLPGDGLGYYVFAGASGQAIARDAFLDGNLFGRSASVHKRDLMGDFEGGAALLWRGTRISYTHTWQTDAFKGQIKGLFNFGSIAVSTRF